MFLLTGIINCHLQFKVFSFQNRKKTNYILNETSERCPHYRRIKTQRNVLESDQQSVKFFSLLWTSTYLPTHSHHHYFTTYDHLFQIMTFFLPLVAGRILPNLKNIDSRKKSQPCLSSFPEWLLASVPYYFRSPILNPFCAQLS